MVILIGDDEVVVVQLMMADNGGSTQTITHSDADDDDEPFFVPEYGHFCQKCPSLRAYKWHFGCPNENSETLL